MNVDLFSCSRCGQSFEELEPGHDLAELIVSRWCPYCDRPVAATRTIRARGHLPQLRQEASGTDPS